MLSNTHRAGLVAAFKTIARAVAGDGVTLNTVLPGQIGTDRLYSLYGGRENADAGAREHIPAGAARHARRDGGRRGVPVHGPRVLHHRRGAARRRRADPLGLRRAG